MNKQTAHELMMDALYGEISAEDKKKLERYLQTHPELQQELEELREVHDLFQEVPELETKEKLMPVEPRTRSLSEWWSQAATLLPRSKWGRSLVAAAACLLLFFIGAAAANLNIHSAKNGFSFHLGYGSQPRKIATDVSNSQPRQVVFTKKQVKAIIREMRERNAKILTTYAKALTKNNQQQLQQIVEYFKHKRMNNLQQVHKMLNHYQTELNQYQRKINHTLFQTHQVMGQMAKAIVVNNKR